MVITTFDKNEDKINVFKLAIHLGYKHSQFILKYSHFTDSILFNPYLESVVYKSGFFVRSHENKQIRNISSKSSNTRSIPLNTFIKLLLIHI